MIRFHIMNCYVISTHAPRERCDFQIIHQTERFFISTHAPRERCDLRREMLHLHRIQFLLTHPVRGATLLKKLYEHSANNFYSRTP